MVLWQGQVRAGLRRLARYAPDREEWSLQAGWWSAVRLDWPYYTRQERQAVAATKLSWAAKQVDKHFLNQNQTNQEIIFASVNYFPQ